MKLSLSLKLNFIPRTSSGFRGRGAGASDFPPLYYFEICNFGCRILVPIFTNIEGEARAKKRKLWLKFSKKAGLLFWLVFFFKNLLATHKIWVK